MAELCGPAPVVLQDPNRLIVHEARHKRMALIAAGLARWESRWR